MTLSKYLIKIIKDIINEEEVLTLDILSDEKQLKLYELAKYHALDHLLYYHIELFTNPDVIKKINKSFLLQIQKSAVQDAELEAICEALENEQIKHMPLKGAIIKHLYPDFSMRSMSDLDILYDVKFRKKLFQVFATLGYSIQNKGSDNHHDVYYKLPFMNLEMHKRMVDDVVEWSKYYMTIWDNAILKPDKAYEYYLSDEDFYIYHIVHAGKHATHGGTGIRTIIDEYVFLRTHNNDLNWEYIFDELEKLNLSLYEKNLKNLAYYWFSDNFNQDDVDVEFLENLSDFIINSGTYGTIKQSMIFDGFASDEMIDTINKSKFKYIMRRIFPPYKMLKKGFPILKKLPILLPFVWLYRLIRVIFRKKQNAFEQMNTLSSIKEEEIKKYKELKEKTGI